MQTEFNNKKQKVKALIRNNKNKQNSFDHYQHAEKIQIKIRD